MGFIPSSNYTSPKINTTNTPAFTSSSSIYSPLHSSSKDNTFRLRRSTQHHPENLAAAVGLEGFNRDPQDLEAAIGLKETSSDAKPSILHGDYCLSVLQYLTNQDVKILRTTSNSQKSQLDRVLHDGKWPKDLPQRFNFLGINMIKEAKLSIPSTKRLVNNEGYWDIDFVMHCLNKIKDNSSDSTYRHDKGLATSHVIKIGDISSLKQHKLIHSENVKADDNWALKMAAQLGRVDVLKFLKDEFGLETQDARAGNNWALRKAAKFGHVDVLRFLKNEFRLEPQDARDADNGALIDAAENGHLEVLKYLRHKFNLWDIDARAQDNLALGEAAKNGHMAIVRYLHKEFKLTATDARSRDNYALRKAVESEHTDIVQFFEKEWDISTNEIQSPSLAFSLLKVLMYYAIAISAYYLFVSKIPGMLTYLGFKK